MCRCGVLCFDSCGAAVRPLPRTRGDTHFEYLKEFLPMTDAPESQVSGRGALAELKEAVTGLVEQVANLVPGRGIFLDPFPRHELQVVDDGFHAWVELPGMKREEVEVAVAGRILTVSGERQLAGAPDGARKLKSERRGGEFELRIELPDAMPFAPPSPPSPLRSSS